MKKKTITSIITGIVIIAIFIATIMFFKDRMYLFKDVNAFKEYVLGFGNWSVPVFLLLQVLQVVVFFIPGELVQIAAGYIFGPWWGFVLCIVGSAIGGVINFIIGMILGRPFVEKLMSKKDNWIIEKLTAINEGKNHKKRLYGAIFLFYLIPGIPKDVLGYICGITSAKFIWYFVLSNLARVPAMLLSTIFGNEISNANWPLLIIIAVVVAIICVLSFFYVKKLKAKTIDKKETVEKKGETVKQDDEPAEKKDEVVIQKDETVEEKDETSVEE